MCAFVLDVCMQGVCPCSNPVITRPGTLRQRNGGRARQRQKKGMDRGQRWSRGLDNNRDQKR